jgi:hypothetical protein
MSKLSAFYIAPSLLIATSAPQICRAQTSQDLSHACGSLAEEFAKYREQVLAEETGAACCKNGPANLQKMDELVDTLLRAEMSVIAELATMDAVICLVDIAEMLMWRGDPGRAELISPKRGARATPSGFAASP